MSNITQAIGFLSPNYDHVTIQYNSMSYKRHTEKN